MSSKFVRKNVDYTIENNIVTASIISTKFLENIYPLMNTHYMRNDFAKIIMKWVMSYFDQFGEAPKKHIQSIFDIEKAKLDETQEDIIKTFLVTLNNNYITSVEGGENGINDEYILDQTLKYFRKREIETRVELAQKLLDVGKVEMAEEELLRMKKVVKMTTNWSNPMDVESIHEVFDDRQKGIFKFPGALGTMLGDLERGWLIAFLAPFKRGKTWTLQEAVVLGALSNLRTVFVSLEMKKKNLNERIYKRLTAYGDEGKTVHAIPVFDCFKNQTGVCEKNIRTNDIFLYDGESDIPEFTPDMEYRPCCVCKDIHSERADYEVATWFEQIEKPEFTDKNVIKRMRTFAKYYGNNIRTITYPRFSASLDDLDRDLDLLEQTEGFIPDIIAMDYADIFRPTNKNGDTRNGIDDIWKNIAALCARRQVLGFTASQGNRGSIYKENMDQTDLAEWIGKLAHVDKFISINQSLQEKRRGVIRFGMLADRHQEFHEKDQCMILQSLALGQVHLDSYNIKGR